MFLVYIFITYNLYNVQLGYSSFIRKIFLNEICISYMNIQMIRSVLSIIYIFILASSELRGCQKCEENNFNSGPEWDSIKIFSKA